MLMKFSWQDTAVVCHCLLWAIQGIWTTCLIHKTRGIPLNALPNDTTSELAGLFSTTSFKCWAPSRESVDITFWSLLVWLDKGIEPRSTNCKADTITTMPLCRLHKNEQKSSYCLQSFVNNRTTKLKCFFIIFKEKGLWLWRFTFVDGNAKSHQYFSLVTTENSKRVLQTWS